MRDVVLMLLVAGLLPLIFWRARIGALMWAWVSMMIPHRLAYGFAASFPFAQVIAICTLVAMLFRKPAERFPFPSHLITTMIILLVAWMSITSLFAKAHPDVVFMMWSQMLKIHLMLIVTLMLLRGREHIDQLIWVMVISIGFYGVKGGVWTVLTGGGERVYGPQGGILGNNNEFALALVMLIPLMYYLMGSATKRWIKYALIGSMIACSFAILGSHSRGAFLAIAAMSILLALKSSRPFLMVMLLALAGLVMLPFMPDHWTSRMESIQTHEDWSAMSRLYTWELVWNLTLDHPIVGAGFSYQSPEIVARYSTIELEAWTAHSIYFQAMGEHGFVGLVLYVSLFACGWLRAGKLARICRAEKELEWVVRLMPMIQVSIAGFAVGGAFLSMVYFDYSYYLLGLVVLADLAAREVLQRKTSRQRGALRSPLAVGWSN